jgi:hypothetical protein
MGMLGVSCSQYVFVSLESVYCTPQGVTTAQAAMQEVPDGGHASAVLLRPLQYYVAPSVFGLEVFHCCTRV